ncbi:hypothetical protein [Nocardioides yefusunii]|uniref:LPXTG cell wall anchor domain-containing protein n=1 Tax=Nocardioides yefusunii TaxID=2500546 RepID=A0ABW1QSE2_9ACTN|nr:hypothetical protein [Nocardioides yefusunii]
MNKRFGLALAVAGLVGVGVVVKKKQASASTIPTGKPVVSFAGIPTAKKVQLPLLCRLRGHGWRIPRNPKQMPLRKACQNCQRIDIPLPR